MENSSNDAPIKKSKKGLVAVVAIVIIAILVGVGYYFLRPTSPKDVFVSKMSEVLESSNKYNANNKVLNSTVTLSGNVETTNPEFSQLAQMLNKGKIMLNVQADTNSKKALVSANVDYQNENFISGKVFYQNDDNIYFYIDELYDKYFKVNLNEAISDEQELQQLKDVISNTTGAKVDFAKASKIMKEAIEKNLKEEFFSKEKIDGMDKNTLKIKGKELKTIAKNVIESLRNNQDYLNCFEGRQDEMKQSFAEAINEVQTMDDEYDDSTLQISLLTKGLKKEVKRIEIKAEEEENESVSLDINKVGEGEAEFVVNVSTVKDNMPVNAQPVKGTIKREKVDNDTEKYSVLLDNIKDLGKVTLNVEVKNTENTDLDNIDVSTSTSLQEIQTNTTEAMKLYSNLSKMKIYQFIAPMIGIQ